MSIPVLYLITGLRLGGAETTLQRLVRDLELAAASQSPQLVDRTHAVDQLERQMKLFRHVRRRYQRGRAREPGGTLRACRVRDGASLGELLGRGRLPHG